MGRIKMGSNIDINFGVSLVLHLAFWLFSIYLCAYSFYQFWISRDSKFDRSKLFGGLIFACSVTHTLWRVNLSKTYKIERFYYLPWFLEINFQGLHLSLFNILVLLTAFQINSTKRKLEGKAEKDTKRDTWYKVIAGLQFLWVLLTVIVCCSRFSVHQLKDKTAGDKQDNEIWVLTDLTSSFFGVITLLFTIQLGISLADLEMAVKEKDDENSYSKRRRRWRIFAFALLAAATTNIVFSLYLLISSLLERDAYQLYYPNQFDWSFAMVVNDQIDCGIKIFFLILFLNLSPIKLRRSAANSQRKFSSLSGEKSSINK